MKTAVPVDEEKETDEEGDLEDTENGSKSIEKMEDKEDHVIDIRFYLLSVWACEFLRIFVINIHAWIVTFSALNPIFHLSLYQISQLVYKAAYKYLVILW